MSLAPPQSVRKLQTALHAKAKGAPGYRFYALYDKLYREDVLAYAYAQLPCQRWRAGGGRPGLRGHRGVRSGAMAGRTGADAQAEDVSTATGPTRVHPEGRTASTGRWASRRSGIAWCRRRRCWCWSRSSRPTCSRNNTPTARARRPARGGRGGTSCCTAGHTEVVDADLAGTSTSIPHAELMKSVSRRISDRHVLQLIKMWLESPVEEIDERGRRTRTTEATRTRAGHPAGLADLAVVGEPVHASVHAGLEDVGARTSASARTSSTMRMTS